MEQKELKNKEQRIKSNRKWQKYFIINTTLFILGIAMSISGLIIQCHYHLLKNPRESIVFALNQAEWNTIHVWASIFFSFTAIHHIWTYRKWYENVLKQKFPAKHRTTLILTILVFIVVISGLIPLFILYSGGSSTLRSSIIEIHDKITILFFIMILHHIIKRFKRYKKQISKL